MKTILSLRAISRIFEKAGASRVSMEAKRKLRQTLETYGIRIAKKALKNAEYAGRILIKPSDLTY